MWIKEAFLCFTGVAGGLAVSAGVFAFAVTLGVVPRFAGKSHTSRYVMSYENVIFWGGMFLLDMAEKEISKGEFRSVCQAVGGIGAMINEECKDKDALALVRYI